MKKIENTIAVIIVAIALAYFYKVALTIAAIIIFIIILLMIGERRSAYRLQKFRTKNNGKYFLWYSSNKRLKETIETKLKPLIDERYEIIYNNRSQVRSELTDEQLRYLRDESGSIKLPILFKVELHRIYAESFFNEVYDCRQKRISDQEFEKRINIKLNNLKNEQAKHKRRKP